TPASRTGYSAASCSTADGLLRLPQKSRACRRARPPALGGGTDMFRRTVTRTTILALAAFGMFVIAGPATAQQGWPINGSNWSYYGASSRSFGRGYSRSYYNSAPAFTTSAPITRSRSYYSAPAEAAPVNNRVTLNLTVPSDAKIWVGGSVIVQMGTQRQM